MKGWTNSFTVEKKTSTATLNVKVYDGLNYLGDTFIGQASLPIESAFSGQETILEDDLLDKKKKVTGKIAVTIKMEGPLVDPPKKKEAQEDDEKAQEDDEKVDSDGAEEDEAPKKEDEGHVTVEEAAANPSKEQQQQEKGSAETAEAGDEKIVYIERDTKWQKKGTVQGT
mgnify:CR=1 FL=1